MGQNGHAIPSNGTLRPMTVLPSSGRRLQRVHREKVTLQLPSIPLKSPTGRAQTSHAFAGSKGGEQGAGCSRHTQQ